MKKPTRRVNASGRRNDRRSGQTKSADARSKKGAEESKQDRRGVATRSATGARKVKPKAPPTVVGVTDARAKLSTYARSVVAHNQPMNITYRDRVVAVLAPFGAVPEDQIVETFSVDEVKKFPRALTGVVHAGPYALTRKGRPVAVLYAPKPAKEVAEQPYRAMDEDLAEMTRLLTSLTQRVENVRKDVAEITRIRINAVEATKRHIKLLRYSGKEGAERAEELEKQLRRLEIMASRGEFEQTDD